MNRIRIAIQGAAGRMGQRLVALGAADARLAIVAALESAHHPRLGEDAGIIAGVDRISVPLTCDLAEESEVDALIDFSVPAAALSITSRCVQRRLPLVMATTGLGPAERAAIEQAAEQIPVVWAPNMSLAVTLTMKLASIAAQTLRGCGRDVDVEIIECHHRFKEDAPSGTALRFGEIIAGALGRSKHVHGRHGRPGPRSTDEIGYHAVRAGDNPGEHTIVLGMLGETIELAVRATNRDCYALGALAAARFVAQQPPGMYSMFDVLGLEA
jgi:4-hydroxy-tetrahydrodipicolinate reductase